MSHLTSKRLLLPRLTLANDFDMLHLLGNDEAGARAMGTIPFPMTVDETRIWISNRTDVKNLWYAIFEPGDEDDLFVGAIGLMGNLESMNLQFWIGQKYRNIGYATEAANALITEARNFGVQKIVGEVFPDNSGARKVLDHLGFDNFGLVSRPYPYRGGMAEVFLYTRALQ